MTTTVFNTKIGEIENKISDTNSLVTTTNLNTKISEIESKTPDHAKYIAPQEFNKYTGENFAARLTQANLVSKIDFDNKLISFCRNVTSNNTKSLEVLKKLDSLTTKVYIFS